MEVLSGVRICSAESGYAKEWPSIEVQWYRTKRIRHAKAKRGSAQKTTDRHGNGEALHCKEILGSAKVKHCLVTHCEGGALNCEERQRLGRAGLRSAEAKQG